MMIPNQEIESIFKETKKRVMEESQKIGSLQSPKSYGNWVGNLVLLWKKDYSKIEVKSLQKEAEEEKENGNIKSAIKKYNVLQNYFESSMQNIDKEKLIKVYIDLGEIYWQLNDSVSTGKDYLNNLTKSANSFLNAKLLLETEGVSSKTDKENYSETFYKYLRVQSYVDFNSDLDGALAEKMIQEANTLINYNEDNFGENDYRTACSYYLSGLFLNDQMKAYNQFTKSAQIFGKVNYTSQDLKEYTYTDNTDYMSYKWSIIAFNKLIAELDDKNIIQQQLTVLKENIHNNTDSIYDINFNIINSGIKMSRDNNN